MAWQRGHASKSTRVWAVPKRQIPNETPYPWARPDVLAIASFGGEPKSEVRTVSNAATSMQRLSACGRIIESPERDERRSFVKYTKGSITKFKNTYTVYDKALCLLHDVLSYYY